MPSAPFTPSDENHVANGIHKTDIPGLFVVVATKHPDERGHYAELMRIPELNQVIGDPFEPVQINHSHSHKQVIRGFHAENWNKLVTVIHGYCFSVLVDVRPDSPTFGQSITIELGDGNNALYGGIFIPAGVANSALALSEPVEYLYFVDQLYSERDTSGDVSISLFDPDIAAPWPIDQSQMILSERDRQSISLREKFPQKFHQDSP